MLCEETNCELKHFNAHFSETIGIFREDLSQKLHTTPAAHQ